MSNSASAIADIKNQLVVSMLNRDLDIDSLTPFEQFPSVLEDIPEYYDIKDWPITVPELETISSNTCVIQLFVPTDVSSVISFSVVSTGSTYSVDWGTAVQQYNSAQIATQSYLNPVIGTPTDGGTIVTIIITADTITGLDFSTRPAGYTGTSSNILAIYINATSCSSLVFRSTSWEHRNCQLIKIVGIGPITTMANLCLNMTELRTILFPEGSLQQVTSMDSAFYLCTKLNKLEFPDGSLSQVTSMASTFYFCTSLVSIDLPAGSLSQVVNMTSCFDRCFQLQQLHFPEGSLQATTSLSNTFIWCAALREVTFSPNSLQYVQTLQFAFNVCRKIRKIEFPEGSLVDLVNMQSAFDGCYSLEQLYFPPGSLSKVTTINNAFINTVFTTLEIPENAFGLVTDATAAFRQCYVLETLSFPFGALANVTNISTMFDNCPALTSVTFDTPACSAVTNATSVFLSVSGLSRLTNFRCPRSFSIANNMLEATGLNEVYTALPTVVGQTITVTGCPGTTGHDPSIATAKGWTVAQ